MEFNYYYIVSFTGSIWSASIVNPPDVYKAASNFKGLRTRGQSVIL